MNEAGTGESGMSKPVLVLVHGWGLHSAIWQPLLEQLNEHFECICLDMPGYGRRTATPSPKALEDLSADLLDQAPEKAHWCAWSLGGMAALQGALTQRHRFESLNLICSTPKFIKAEDWPLGMDMDIFAKFTAELEADYDSGIRKFLLLQAGSGSVARDAAKQAAKLLEQHPEPSGETLRAGLEILQHADLHENLKNIDVPCRVISGRRDRIVHPSAGQALQQGLKNAELFEFNSGHAPHLSHTEELSTLLIQRLLERVA